MITNRQKERFEQKANQIMDELKTYRDISACLGSVGLTFSYDVHEFIEFLLEERDALQKDSDEENK